MMLELEIRELLPLLDSDQQLQAIVDEAPRVLEQSNETCVGPVRALKPGLK